MKKIIALLLVLVMAFALCACGGTSTAQPAATAAAETAAAEPASGANTLYVLGPTPDHGWTAQAGTYAEQKCEEITKEGTYKAGFELMGVAQGIVGFNYSPKLDSNVPADIKTKLADLEKKLGTNEIDVTKLVQ